MRVAEGLILQLHNRRQAVAIAPRATLPRELGYLLDWLQSETATRSLLNEICALPGLTAEEWRSAHLNHRTFDLPADERAAARIRYLVLRHLVDSGGDPAMDGHAINFGESSLDACAQYFVEVFVDPLVTWILGQLLAADALLHTLVRFSREVGWFERERLEASYRGNTKRGEAVLDHELRRALLREGVDYPFSQAVSPSGRADVLVVRPDEKPLAIEVKVFDPENGRSDDHVRSGVPQAAEYARDYGSGVAYLVVFDLSKEGLVFEGAELQDGVPVAHSGEIAVFCIVVPVAAHPVASSRAKQPRRIVDLNPTEA